MNGGHPKLKYGTFADFASYGNGAPRVNPQYDIPIL